MVILGCMRRRRKRLAASPRRRDVGQVLPHDCLLVLTQLPVTQARDGSMGGDGECVAGGQQVQELRRAVDIAHCGGRGGRGGRWVAVLESSRACRPRCVWAWLPWKRAVSPLQASKGPYSL